MTRLLLLIPWVALWLAGCKDGGSQRQAETGSEGKASWYSTWISERDGEIFHTEVSLVGGEVVEVSIPSETALTVGFIVEKGYEITKDSGTIFMGTDETPRAVSGSPGTWREFEADAGAVEVRFENSSSITTRLAIYTKPKI